MIAIDPRTPQQYSVAQVGKRSSEDRPHVKKPGETPGKAEVRIYTYDGTKPISCTLVEGSNYRGQVGKISAVCANFSVLSFKLLCFPTAYFGVREK